MGHDDQARVRERNILATISPPNSCRLWFIYIFRSSSSFLFPFRMMVTRENEIQWDIRKTHQHSLSSFIHSHTISQPSFRFVWWKSKNIFSERKAWWCSQQVPQNYKLFIAFPSNLMTISVSLCLGEWDICFLYESISFVFSPFGVNILDINRKSLDNFSIANRFRVNENQSWELSLWITTPSHFSRMTC